jgi:hypothetical protein
MKVFISWSGAVSKQLGEALRDWLPGVLQLVTPYFTPSDIEKGTRWSADIAKELENSQIGVLCITRDNLHSDWILFEAGALSKSLEKAHVCPILFGITPTDLSGPLKQFQTTTFEKNEIHKLIMVINNGLGEHKLTPKTLDNVFEKWWPDLDKKIKEILAKVSQPEQPVRSDRELIEEILLMSRANSRRVTSSPKAMGAVIELAENFINLHDEQIAKIGGYQETLDTMQCMHKSLISIASRYVGHNEEIGGLVERLQNLTFLVLDEEDDHDDDDISF